jgi:hypothetical protein
MQTVLKFIAILFLLQACGPAYDKSFNERISEIKIPEDASIVETIDNGEFMTVTTFKLTASDMGELHRNISSKLWMAVLYQTFLVTIF